MQTHIRCGKLFSGLTDQAEADQVVVLDGEVIAYAGAAGQAPNPKPEDRIVDHTDAFVMPGLIDNHVHLSYGEAKTEEDIDLYASLEFRALRGMEAAQRVLKAGITSMTDPTTSGLVSLAIRDAVEAGLFVGPRITCSGPSISTRQGLIDWYPTWIGVPSTAIGEVLKSTQEGKDIIRRQIKNGVDIIKLAMDGDSMNPSSNGLIAAFDQEEVVALVTEAQRLGRKVAVHARGAEGVLYAARAGVDLIYHASWMDEEALEAVVEAGCPICPTLGMLVNNIEFSQPSDGAYGGLVDAHRAELEAATRNLARAREAGVPMLLGSETGFAVTPYGEWHGRELEHHMKYIGFSAGEVLRQATGLNAGFHRMGPSIGALEAGRKADILVLAKDPLQDIQVLQDKDAIIDIYLGGEAIDRTPNTKRRRIASEFSYSMWSEVYTQERVAERRAPH